MDFIKNRSYILCSLVFCLFAISAYLVHMNFSISNHTWLLVIGFILMCLMMKMDAAIWFHRIGTMIFVVSVLLLMIVFFDPNVDRSTSCHLILGGMKIEPMAFFAIGATWFISRLHGMREDNKQTNITIFILMIITAIFCIKVNDMRALPMLKAYFFAWLFYSNGISKVSIVSFFVAMGVSIFFILSSSHQVVRISMWWESSSDFMTTLAIDANLHENILLTLIHNLGYFAFGIVVVLFLALAYGIFTCKYKNKNYKLFAEGIVFLILIDLGLNILYIFGLSPFYPPTLYFFGYGSSTVLASFIAMAMLMMGMKNNHLAKAI